MFYSLALRWDPNRQYLYAVVLILCRWCSFLCGSLASMQLQMQPHLSFLSRHGDPLTLFSLLLSRLLLNMCFFRSSMLHFEQQTHHFLLALHQFPLCSFILYKQQQQTHHHLEHSAQRNGARRLTSKLRLLIFSSSCFRFSWYFLLRSFILSSCSRFIRSS